MRLIIGLLCVLLMRQPLQLRNARALVISRERAVGQHSFARPLQAFERTRSGRCCGCSDYVVATSASCSRVSDGSDLRKTWTPGWKGLASCKTLARGTLRRQASSRFFFSLAYACRGIESRAKTPAKPAPLSLRLDWRKAPPLPPVHSSSDFRVLLFFRRRRLAKRDASWTASREVQASTWQGQPRNRAVTRRYATPVDAKRTTETRRNDGPRPGARPGEARPSRTGPRRSRPASRCPCSRRSLSRHEGGARSLDLARRPSLSLLLSPPQSTE